MDLTQIVSFESDESGIAHGGIPLPNSLPGFAGQWNYWHDILVFLCPPAGPGHFACYKMDEKTMLRIPAVSLAGQFGAECDVQVRKPREICLPVDRNSGGIGNRDDHLVCYDVAVRRQVDGKVLVSKQFGEQRLCVPSRKQVIH